MALFSIGLLDVVAVVEDVPLDCRGASPPPAPLPLPTTAGLQS